MFYKLEKYRYSYYEGTHTHTVCMSESVDALKNFVSDSDTELYSQQWEKDGDCYNLTIEISYFEKASEKEVYEDRGWTISPVKVI